VLNGYSVLEDAKFQEVVDGRQNREQAARVRRDWDLVP